MNRMMKSGVVFLAFLIQLANAGARSNSIVTHLEKSTDAVLAQAAVALASIPMDDVETGLSTMDIIDFKMELRAVAITALSTFKLLDVRYEETSGTVRIRVNFPSMQIRGRYNLNGTAISIVPLFGGGGFRVTSKDLILTFNGSLPLGEPSPQIETSRVFLYDQTYTASFDSLLGGGLVLSMVTGRVTPLLGKMVFDIYRSDLQGQLTEFFTAAYNKELLYYKP